MRIALTLQAFVRRWQVETFIDPPFVIQVLPEGAASQQGAKTDRYQDCLHR